MKLYYATNNTGKIISLQREFNPLKVKILKVPIDLPEPRSDNIQEIAKAKVAFAYQVIKKPVVALDAGFFIHSLNGFPKAFVNFTLETIGLEGILRLVENKDRSCEFRECLAYQDDSLEKPKLFVSNVKGSLSNKPEGTMKNYLWSKLGLIFIPEDGKKTLAEMSYNEYHNWRRISREKNSSSRLFAEWFNSQNF